MIRCAGRQGVRRFSKDHILLPLAFAGLLIGCSQEKPEDQNTTGNTAAPVAMPPAIVASHSYRCSDGQELYVDFLQDDLSINVRKSSAGPILRLAAPAQGLAYVGDRMNVTLDGKDLKLEEPNRKPVTCKRA